ncbi:MAG: PAS domain-containing protein [Fuerstiella sp.]
MPEESENATAAISPDAARFQQIFDICSDGIAICRDQKIVEANPRLAELLHAASAESLCGRSMASLVAPASRATTVECLEDLMNAPPASGAFCPTTLLREDSGTIDVEIRANRTSSRDGQEQIYTIRPGPLPNRLNDLTRDDLKRLAYMQRMTVFAESVASEIHDLGQPLTAAWGATEVLVDHLLQEPRSDDLKRAVEIVAGSTQKATAQFRRIWEFVLDRTTGTECTEVDAVLEHALGLMKPSARHAGCTILFDPRTTGASRVDRPLTELIVISLLSRALTTLRGQPGSCRQIEVGVRELDADHVQILISHNASTADDEVPAASSLAVTLCRTLAERHGGRLDIDTATEQPGIHYRLTLPTQSAEPPCC